jgi:hypothetical protein
MVEFQRPDEEVRYNVGVDLYGFGICRLGGIKMVR